MEPVQQGTDSELKTPEEWSTIYGIRIMDPDGWRMPNAPKWDTPISREEFSWRMGISSITVEDPDSDWPNFGCYPS
jgi:hypothetical protein